ncbi:MAG: transferase [Chloroflexus sp.]|uniref:acyltransferase n=1 Tax=Chloroflexus sp. TaxID=1904827 RepID=UPI0021DE1508|nr:acyltransferase [Chloroflexus sp.]GIV90759.1 MAG: transferase [Chloroflexus sp.]
MRQHVVRLWTSLWMRYAGPHRLGKVATWLAALPYAPYKARVGLAHRYPQGYIAPSAQLNGRRIRRGRHVFIGDEVVIYQRQDGGPIELADYVELHRDTIIECGRGGSVVIGERTGLQPRCQLSAYVEPIVIGRGCQIAPQCAFYPYDHGTAPGQPIGMQPLTSKGPIVLEDDVWLGYGVVVLSGVTIGSGTVVGAGSVVTKSLPAGVIAVGAPARVVRERTALDIDPITMR